MVSWPVIVVMGNGDIAMKAMLNFIQLESLITENGVG